MMKERSYVVEQWREYDEQGCRKPKGIGEVVGDSYSSRILKTDDR